MSFPQPPPSYAQSQFPTTSISSPSLIGIHTDLYDQTSTAIPADKEKSTVKTLIALSVGGAVICGLAFLYFCVFKRWVLRKLEKADEELNDRMGDGVVVRRLY